LTPYNNRLENLSKRNWKIQSILDVFVLQKILEYDDAETLKKNFKTQRDIENFLLRNKLVTKDTINKAYSILLKLPFVGLKNVKISEEAKIIVPRFTAIKYGIIAFDVSGNTIRLAIARPADLLLGYGKGLLKLFKAKDVKVEVYITGNSDFEEAIKQYNQNQSLLLKRGSYPVIFLRNYKISADFKNKLPYDFINKYRVIIIGENINGDYMVACQDPNTALTKKVLAALASENKIKIEIFASSKDDFDYIIKHWYDNDKEENLTEVQNDEKSNAIKEDASISFDFDLAKFLGFEKKKEEEAKITVDSVQPGPIAKTDLPRVVLSKIEADEKIVNLLPRELSKKHRLVLFGVEPDNKLSAASDTPFKEDTKKTIEFVKKQHPIKLYLCATSELNGFLERI